MANNISFTKSLTKTLLIFFKNNVEGIVEGYDDFPNASQNLKFPSISIMLDAPQFTPTPPREVYIGPKILTGPDINKAVVRKVIGKYDYEFQLDFWCASKPQRHQIYESFINALNATDEKSGKVIDLVDYYNEKTQIDIRGMRFDDDEESSQRNHWRFRVTLFGNARCIREKLEYLMSNIEVTVTTEN